MPTVKQSSVEASTITFFRVSGEKPKTCCSLWLQFLCQIGALHLLLFYRRTKWDRLETYPLNIEAASQAICQTRFPNKMFGKESRTDSPDAGRAPPAICGKRYSVSHQLRARKWRQAPSKNFTVKRPHLTGEPRVYKEKRTEWVLLFLRGTMRMSRILQKSKSFNNQTVTSVLSISSWRWQINLLMVS